MNEKKSILETFMPVVVLKALTDEAELAVPQNISINGYIPIRNFPFRVGRESRVKIIDGRIERLERVRANQVEPTNDLYLIDNGRKLNISREHLQIEREADKFYLFDRGSSCGTIVGEERLDKKQNSTTTELRDGDTIIIGTRQSPYVYQFVVLDGFEIKEKEKEGITSQNI